MRIRNRRGFTLTEVLLMSFIAMGLFVVVWRMMDRSMLLSDASTQSVKLQTELRNLLEHMVEDLGGCHQFLTPTSGPPNQNVAIARYRTPSAQVRLGLNPSLAYPFMETPPAATSQKLDILRVEYHFDPARHTLTRQELPGLLVSEADPGQSRFTRYRFDPEPGGRPEPRLLAESVDVFEISYVGYEKGTGNLIFCGAAPPAGAPLELASCLALHLVAAHEGGQYKRDKNPPKVEILTKLWALKRLNDEMYKEYFTSGDDDVRY